MIRSPLVIGDQGQFQRLQPGDSIAQSAPQFSAVNGDSFNHVPGTVVYISSSGTVQAAIANSINTVRAVAISAGTNAPGASGSYQDDGLASGYVGLSPNATYFLSPTSAGGVTSVVPNSNGQWLMVVGVAFDATRIEIAFGTPVQL